MVLMGLHEEEQRAREWVEKRLDFDRDGNYNTFEVCIYLLSLGKKQPSNMILLTRRPFECLEGFSQHITSQMLPYILSELLN